MASGALVLQISLRCGFPNRPLHLESLPARRQRSEGAVADVTGLRQTLIALITDESAPRLRSKNAVNFAVVITKLREASLR
jgi:hypothetical protein